MKTNSHLATEIIDILDWTDEERIQFIRQDKWIKYGQAEQVLERLNDLYHYPRSERMPNLILVGDSGIGKTTILSSFENDHERKVTDEGDLLVPVLRIDMPSEPNESRFWSEILTKLRVSHRLAERAYIKQQQAERMLIYIKTKLLIIDEIHNMLLGSAKQQRQFMAILKNLSNKLKIPLVLSGTRESILVLNTDSQLASRFEPIQLPNWELNIEFRRLLVSFESLLPLFKPSGLDSKGLAIRLYEMSEGNLGSLAKILEAAAVIAIKTEVEQITHKVLDDINWVKLSEYGKAIEMS